MSEEFGAILFEVQRTQRALVQVKVPRGVFYRRGEWWQLLESGPRKCSLPGNFWDWLDDFAKWESIGSPKVRPFEALGPLQACPKHCSNLDARPYLANMTEGEE